jgi:hypothetical protein
VLRQVWNAYRGWAKLARDLQSETRRWNLAALLCVGAFAQGRRAIGSWSLAPTWLLRASIWSTAEPTSAIRLPLGRRKVTARTTARTITGKT